MNTPMQPMDDKSAGKMLALAQTTEKIELALAQSAERIGPAEKQCDAHGLYMATGTLLKRIGREVWSPCPACEAERMESERSEAQARAERARQDKLEAMLERAAIPPRFLAKSLESFNATAEPQRKALAIVAQYLADFDEQYRTGRGLILAGPPGTGKSHLAVSVLRAVMPRYFGVYATCADYIRSIRGTWHKDAEKTEAQVLDEYARVSLLVLDEIGVAFGTEGEQKHLFDLLDRRYRDMRPTIILTNEDSEGLKRFVGERVFDRLQETATWVPCNWPSYRATARKEAA